MSDCRNTGESATGDGADADDGWPDVARIRTYYDQTQFDYRAIWLNKDNRAMHFGYWNAWTRSHADSLINMNRVLARRIGIRRGDRVLDAGCGVGGSAIWLAKTYGVAVVGITPVAGQVARAYRYARQHGIGESVAFAQQDYTRTTFTEGCFDVVWAMESVCHAPDKRRFFAEARRLLRPGGRLGIAEYMRSRRPLDMDGEHLLATWVRSWEIPDLGTGDEFRAWASEAGFTDVQVWDCTPHVRRSLRRMARIAAFTWPLALLLRALHVRNDLQHRHTRGAWEQYRALRRGDWFYGMLTATASPPS